MLLCAAAFTACNEDFPAWDEPQSQAQDADAAAYGLTLTPAAESNIVMDNASETVKLVSIAANDEIIAKYVLKSVTVNEQTIAAQIEDGNVVVSAALLDSLVQATTFDRSATPHALAVTTELAGVLTSGEAIPVTASTTATLTPSANTPVKDPKGYAMLGQWQGWNPAEPTWMTEVEPGIYQAEVTTTDEQNWFKFYQGSGFDAADFTWDDVALGCAVNGDESSPNLLVWANDPRYGKFESPVIAGAATYVVTLDMNKFYYKYELKEKKYYVVGDAQGWSNSDKSCLFYPMGSNQYTYTTKWTNQWSLKIWDEDTFGNWDAAWGGVNGSTDATGSLVNSNAGAFGPNEAGGWYTLVINMGTKTYEWTAIDEPAEFTAIGIIGGFNDWAADVDMTQLEKAPHNWRAQLTLNSDTELKFRANHDWAVNWGGDSSAEINEDVYYVAPGGDNIKVPAGTYDVFFNDITGRFNIVKVQ